MEVGINWRVKKWLLLELRIKTPDYNGLNTLSLSQTLYCVVVLYMFRVSSVHLQEALH
jgi:hypothetical protein